MPKRLDSESEKSVGTTERHYSTKKQKHSFSILKAFFVRHSSEYETSDNDRKVNRKAIYFGSPFVRYPTFHTLTSVGRKNLSVC